MSQVQFITKHVLPLEGKISGGGKAALAGSPNGDICKSMKRENDSLKRIIGEITVANDALKKNAGGRQKMMAVKELAGHISLNKSLTYCGLSKTAWYYTKRPRA